MIYKQQNFLVVYVCVRSLALQLFALKTSPNLQTGHCAAVCLHCLPSGFVLGALAFVFAFAFALYGWHVEKSVVAEAKEQKTASNVNFQYTDRQTDRQKCGYINMHIQTDI